MLRHIYKTSLALLTDLYQLTMAYGYWKTGAAEREAIFNLFYRRNPFGGGYGISCGLEHAIDFVEHFDFSDSDLSYLAELRGNDAEPLFADAFLEFLGKLELSVHLDAVPEGEVVFPHEPLVRVTGPLIECQLLETPLLNLINFQTLLATKASRVCRAAGDDPVLEFGLRRAQGVDGGLAASRAAYVGGCAATSNVLAGKLFGIPIRGTHAHSWVMTFADERTAFRQYAEAMPNNCVFLVDTYDTVEGVERAIEVGHWLREQGHEMVGVRLDSGDLADLSIKSRRLLDEAGFPEASIVASNDLDEHSIARLKAEGACIGVWGVGTKLATAYDQPALGGVYKMAAIREPGQSWTPRIKLSDTAIKVSNPGRQQLRRFYSGDVAVADLLFEPSHGPDPSGELVPLGAASERRRIPPHDRHEDLLVPIFEAGRRIYEPPSLRDIRARRQRAVAAFAEAVLARVEPGTFLVGLDPHLDSVKTSLIGALTD